MINPILASSTRRRMRTLRTPVVITVYCLVLLVFMYIYAFQAYGQATISLYQMRKSMEGYIFVLGLQFVLLVLVAPAMTAGSIAGERERQTLDLLRVTQTSSFSIVIGKLLESYGFLCLLILTSMPMLSLILLTGGIGLGQIAVGLLFLFVVALAVLSVGLFCSALFKRTVTATVVSYLAVFALGVVTLIPLVWDVRILGELYTMTSNQSMALTHVDYVPLAFVLNPGLGLLALLESQTGMVFSLIASYSHTLNVTQHLLRFEQYMLYNMGFMLGLSLVLIVLSTLLVRSPRVGKRRLGRRKGKA